MHVNIDCRGLAEIIESGGRKHFCLYVLLSFTYFLGIILSLILYTVVFFCCFWFCAIKYFWQFCLSYILTLPVSYMVFWPPWYIDPANFIRRKQTSCRGFSRKNLTFCYIDDVLLLNKSKLNDFVDCIYPTELEIKDTTDTSRSISYLELHLEIDSEISSQLGLFHTLNYT